MLFQNPTPIFERLDRAQSQWTRGGATIAVSTADVSGSKTATYRLDLDGSGGATLRIKAGSQGGNGATDNAFIVRGDRLTGIDYVGRERLTRTVPTKGSVGDRLATALGGIDDSVAFLTSKEVRARYIGPMKALKGWTAVPNGLVRRSGGKGKTSLTRLDFDASGRLKRLHIEFPGSRLDWSIAYGPYVALRVPTGLHPVESFVVRGKSPRYADASAREATEAFLRAGRQLRSAIVRIDGRSTLWIDGARLRYEGEGRGLSYDGRILTLSTPGAAYQGRSPRNAILDYSATLLGSVDPLMRSVLVRTPLYSDLFTPDVRVRLVGTMATAGQSCDVLALDGPRYRASIFVRKSDHLPVSVETEAIDRRGNAVSRTVRTLAWSSVGVPLPRALFALRLRSGQTLLTLPRRGEAATGP